LVKHFLREQPFFLNFLVFFVCRWLLFGPGVVRSPSPFHVASYALSIILSLSCFALWQASLLALSPPDFTLHFFSLFPILPLPCYVSLPLALATWALLRFFFFRPL